MATVKRQRHGMVAKGTHLGVILNCAPCQMCDPGQIIGCHSAKMSSLKRGMLVSWGLNGLAWLQSFIMLPRIQQAEEGSERRDDSLLKNAFCSHRGSEFGF